MSQANVRKLQSESVGKTISQKQSSTPRRRTWTAKQKLDVVNEIEKLRSNGADVGSYLRKNGLFGSTVSLWKKQRNQGFLISEGKKRGPKSKLTPDVLEIQRLQKELEKTNKKLAQAEKIIAVQKKIAEILQLSEE